MPQLQGLADEFWLAAYDNTNDEPRIPPYALGVGLATALIAELIDAELVGLRSGELLRLTAVLPDDPALCAVVTAMLQEEQSWPRATSVWPSTRHGDVVGPPSAVRVPRHRQRGHDLALWIDFLAFARWVEARVAERVARTGRALPVERRRLLRSSSRRIVPRDSVVAGTPAFAINESVRRGQVHELTTAQLFLVGLMVATRLDQHALFPLQLREREVLNRELFRLQSSNQTATALLKAADVAVSSAAMTRR
jgi:hypothetical protein